MKVAGMASNRGRNLLHLDDLRPGGADLAVVLTDDADAPVLDRAADRGIPAEVVERAAGESRRDHERRVVAALDPYGFDLVCLDGYVRVLSETFLDAVPTTLNVHPSLLPSFPGMDAHGQALDAGVRVTGCTVHVVTNAVAEDGSVVEEAVDAGPVVTQEPVPVYEGDDAAALERRVLYEGEFRAYPRAVRWFAEDRVDVDPETGEVAVDGDGPGRPEGAGQVDSGGARPDRTGAGGDGGGPAFPARRLVSSDRADRLRYGENPHQAAAVYADDTCEEASVVRAPQLNGGAKALSYNNYNDADAALDLVKEFAEPAAAVIKHTNPAGCATAATPAEAYDRALRTDPMSAFGGVVALNRECDRETAVQVTDSFKEVVVAPGYTGDALDVLRAEENLRVLAVGDGTGALGPDDRTERTVEKPVTGGRLVQERDLAGLSPADLTVPTEREPTDGQVETMLFAWRVTKHVRSNAIVLADGTETVGVGMGQVSRVDAVRLAALKADEHAEDKSAEGAVMASDAFFPFPDGVEVAAEAGVEAVVQPGGSVNDDDVVAACDDLGLAMAFTGRRAFRHD